MENSDQPVSAYYNGIQMNFLSDPNGDRLVFRCARCGKLIAYAYEEGQGKLCPLCKGHLLPQMRVIARWRRIGCFPPRSNGELRKRVVDETARRLDDKSGGEPDDRN